MKKKSTPLECRDTGMAFTFLALLIWIFTKNTGFIYLAMVLLLWAMIWPASLDYPARAWFGFSRLLGTVVSKVILTLIYFIIVVPMALIRKAMGKDAMRFKQYRDGQPSAFVQRDHTFTKDDLDNAF